MSYCLLAALKTYLGITVSDDDALLQTLLDAATSRIDSRTQRVFFAASDTVRRFDPTQDVMRGELWLDADLSYITSLVNGDGVTLTASDYYHDPINSTPWRKIGLRTSSTKNWTYTTDAQDAIVITGRWARMDSGAITAIARATNIVTATVLAPNLSIGQPVTVPDITGFSGTYTITAKTDTSVSWAHTGADGAGTAGTLLYAPPEIAAACKRLAGWLYRQKDTQQSGTSVPLFNSDGSIVMPSTLPQDVEDTLRPYMRLI